MGTSYPVTHFSIFRNCLAMQNSMYGANPRLHNRQMCLYEPSSSDYPLHFSLNGIKKVREENSSVAANIRKIEYLRLHRIFEHASQKSNIRNATLRVQLSVQSLNSLIAARSLHSCIVECATITAIEQQTTSSTYFRLQLLLPSLTYAPFVACTFARNTYVLLRSL